MRFLGARDEGAIREAFEAELRNLRADEALDVADVVRVFRSHERKRIADGLRPAGAADAVNVILGLFRDIVIDNVGDAGDVDAAGGDVRRDHDFIFATLESGERLDALVLRTVRVEDGDGMVGGFEPARDFVGTVLRAGEYQHAVEIGLREERFEQFEFLVGGDRIEGVVDGRGDGAGNATLDARRIAEGKRGDRRDLRRNRGGEKQCLALLRAARDDVFDDREKPHVEHPVYLIEDENGDVTEADFAGFEVVHQAARRGDDDVDAALEVGTLGTIADTTEDRDGADIGEAGEIAKRGFDLRGEFARGLEHEHAGAPVLAEAGEDGQRERRRLAGAGLGGSNEVAATKDDGDRAQLNGRGIGVTGGLDAAENIFGQIESFKGHDLFRGAILGAAKNPGGHSLLSADAKVPRDSSLRSE